MIIISNAHPPYTNIFEQRGTHLPRRRFHRRRCRCHHYYGKIYAHQQL